MKIRLCLCFFIVLAFLVSPVFAQPGLAHGDEPRIEISAELLIPGSVLDIRGVDFEFEEQVSLTLAGQQSELALGSLQANTEGIFLLTITLPVDLPEGTYFIRATTDDHVVDSPQITVWGTAVLEAGEEGLRDEDDGLLAPMPTFAPAQPAAASPAAPQQVAAPPAGTTISPLIWIAAGLGLALAAGLLLRWKR